MTVITRQIILVYHLVVKFTLTGLALQKYITFAIARSSDTIRSYPKIQFDHDISFKNFLYKSNNNKS